jgi:ribosomal protein L37AE/L43A
LCDGCKCHHDIVYGPGDDDYGRDNFEEDWECPGCHKKSKFTRRSIRMGIWKCPQCEWISEDAKQFDKMIERVIKKHGDINGRSSK